MKQAPNKSILAHSSSCLVNAIDQMCFYLIPDKNMVDSS